MSGRIQQEGKVGSTRRELDCWMKTLPQPWTVANGCLVLPSAGTDAERHTLRVEHPGNDDLYALPSVPGHPGPRLTDDLHGGRHTESFIFDNTRREVLIK